jgi:hypothetical protein
LVVAPEAPEPGLWVALTDLPRAFADWGSTGPGGARSLGQEVGMDPLAWSFTPLSQSVVWLLCLAASLSFWVIPGESHPEGGRS